MFRKESHSDCRGKGSSTHPQGSGFQCLRGPGETISLFLTDFPRITSRLKKGERQYSFELIFEDSDSRLASFKHLINGIY
jgi:hypothetical protein